MSSRDAFKERKGGPQSANRQEQETKPVVEIEGQDAAIRGTSVQPGEAGNHNTERGGGIGLTDSLDRYEYEDGTEGRLGGENSVEEEDVVGGGEADEFDFEGEPRRPVVDW